MFFKVFMFEAHTFTIYILNTYQMIRFKFACFGVFSAVLN